MLKVLVNGYGTNDCSDADLGAVSATFSVSLQVLRLLASSTHTRTYTQGSTILVSSQSCRLIPGGNMSPKVFWAFLRPFSDAVHGSS